MLCRLIPTERYSAHDKRPTENTAPEDNNGLGSGTRRARFMSMLVSELGRYVHRGHRAEIFRCEDSFSTSGGSAMMITRWSSTDSVTRRDGPCLLVPYKGVSHIGHAFRHRILPSARRETDGDGFRGHRPSPSARPGAMSGGHGERKSCR